MKKTLTSLVLASVTTLSNCANLENVPSTNEASKVSMYDVTGDRLLDLLYTKDNIVYVQKNLGNGKYDFPVNFEEARKTGNYGQLSTREEDKKNTLPIFFGLLLAIGISGYVSFKVLLGLFINDLKRRAKFPSDGD